MVHQQLFDLLFPPEDLLTMQLLTDPTCLKSWDVLESMLEPIQVKRGDVLSVGEGVPDRIYFMEKGAIKGYRYKSDKIHVGYLWQGPSLVGDIQKFVQEEPSDLFIEVVQDATLLMLERETLNNIRFGHFEIHTILASLTYYLLHYHNQRNLDFAILTDFERFEKLFLNRNSIDLIFSKSDLASFLNIDLPSFKTFYKEKMKFPKNKALREGSSSKHSCKLKEILIDDHLKRQIELFLNQSIN